jgi:hypothetical protein
MKYVLLFELTSLGRTQNKILLVLMLIVAPLFWYINVMRNEEVISVHLNLFSLKPHNGLELNFLSCLHNTVPVFFLHIYNVIKNWKKKALYGDYVIPSVLCHLIKGLKRSPDFE